MHEAIKLDLDGSPPFEGSGAYGERTTELAVQPASVVVLVQLMLCVYTVVDAGTVAC